jgi:hypothetical protein
LSKFKKKKLELINNEFVSEFVMSSEVNFSTLYTKKYFTKQGINAERLLTNRQIKTHMTRILKFCKKLIKETKIKKKNLIDRVGKNELIERKEFFIEHYIKEYKAMGYYFLAKYYQLFKFYYKYHVDLSSLIEDNFSKVVFLFFWLI